jgi:hypothetical protein
VPALSFAGNRYQTDRTYYYVKPHNGPARISAVWENKGKKIVIESQGQRLTYKKGKVKLIKKVSGSKANKIYNKQLVYNKKIESKKVKYRKELAQCFETRQVCLRGKPKLPMHYNGGDINGDPFKCGVVYEAVGRGANQKMRPLSKEEGRRRVINAGKGLPRYSKEDIRKRDEYVANCNNNHTKCKKRYGLGDYDY